MGNITSLELYQKQNRTIHIGIGMLGMPYHSHKGVWIETINKYITKRTVSSLKDMTLKERCCFLRYLNQRGAKVYNPHIPGIMKAWKSGDPLINSKQKRPFHTDPERAPKVRKVHAILADLKLPWAYADKIAKDRFGKEFVEWLEPDRLHKVVQMLSTHQKRQKAKMKGAA